MQLKKQIKVFMFKINQSSLKLTTKAPSFSSVFSSSYSPVLGDRSAVVFVVILLLNVLWSLQSIYGLFSYIFYLSLKGLFRVKKIKPIVNY